MSESATESAGTGTAQTDEANAGTGTDPVGTGTGTEQPAGTAGQESGTETDGTDWRARSREWEKRAKANSKAATELEEIKKSQMTELELAQSQIAEAQRERDEARADHSRVMAAAAHDLPVELIDYLGSGTDEEISDRAEAIAGAIETRATEIAEGRVQELLAQQGGGRNGFPGARPVESMRAGSAPSGNNDPRTSNEWFRSLLSNRD